MLCQVRIVSDSQYTTRAKNTLYFHHRRDTIEPMPTLAGSYKVK